MRDRTGHAARRRTAAVAALLLVTAGLAVGSGTASASAFCGASGLALPGERNHQIDARTSTWGSPGYEQYYRVHNGGPAAVAVAVRGYDAANKETWSGVPLGAGGSDVTLLVPWGNNSAPPAIRVTNLDPARGASVNFACSS
ncbi:MAG: hypothetical protein QOE59_3537 [Actinomycetota bacterium]|jgi:hypothetical protein|nr:hypothetical protein [Actinomycetota bacterium]